MTFSANSNASRSLSSGISPIESFQARSMSAAVTPFAFSLAANRFAAIFSLAM
jgi:hypothetical protein